jgi:hypothetical protein
MKQTQRFIHGLVACGIALAMVTGLSAQTKDEVAKVVRISGSARFTTGGGVWQPLKVGDLVRPGSVIQTDTAEGSYVDLVVGDSAAPVAAAVPVASVAAPSKGGLVRYQPATQQNALRVFENTVLGIDKLTTMDTGADVVTETQLDLKAGHILGNVKKMNAASRYEVKLPNGVAGIRGTVFHLWADGRLTVSSGAVVYSFVDAQNNVQTRDVMGGQQYNPRSDQVVPADPGQLKWMGSTAGSMVVSTVVIEPVVLDMTTYYVAPQVSPTEGQELPGEE